MKRTAILSVALCLALAGCSAGASAPDTAGTSAASSQPAGTAEAAATAAGPLQDLLPNPNSYCPGADGVYLTASVGGDALVGTLLRWDTGEQAVLCSDPGCTHDSASCPAYLGSMADGVQGRVLPVGDRLYWLALDGASCTVTVSGADGSGRAALATLPVQALQTAYTDGEALYLLWTRDSYETVLTRLDPATGAAAECAVRPGTAWSIGTWGSRAVVQDSTGSVAAMDVDGSVTPMALPTGTLAARADGETLYTIVPDGDGLALTARPLDDPDTALETLAELPQAEAVGASLGPVYGGQMQVIVSEATSVTAYWAGTAGGAVELPAVSMKDGTDPRPAQIYAGNDQWLWVTTGVRDETFTALHDDGTPYTATRPVDLTALVATADLANPDAATRPCTRLDG